MLACKVKNILKNDIYTLSEPLKCKKKTVNRWNKINNNIEYKNVYYKRKQKLNNYDNFKLKVNIINWNCKINNT